ncbi:hypothetical protein BX257_4055 [Streptomyces sp. 3212.3]|uniref:hypothetical protein n=1 Tax=Streptomyces sp. 3212.3 TaxID=1938846 RepID=UPI000E36E894|nr:hypothetical protein [Streptomyces sp. 3212.3]REE61476.1 hypothetical protein BX257_4055 [Streptomyces sp. 3212.3]
MREAIDLVMAELGDEERLTIHEYLGVTGLINDALTAAYNDDDSPFARGASGSKLPIEDWLSTLPESLIRVLVELLVPIADSPHRGHEFEATLAVLNALGDGLSRR